MPIRNPFRKAGVAPGLEPVNDENSRPGSGHTPDRGFERASLPSAKSSNSILSIKSKRDEPNEYKLSVVNDSGVYLPPSPTERQSFWHGSNASTTSSNHRSLLSENEPFSISRESFDSYRRSFDISARSPVIQPDGPPLRQSLDSRSSRISRTLASERRLDRHPPTAEEKFEDVGLNDDVKPKKKSIFARFADSTDANSNGRPTSPSGHHGFSFTGRKRGHSGQGAELGKIDRPTSAGAQEVRVDS